MAVLGNRVLPSYLPRFLILEYVEGGELFDYLVKSVRLTPNEVDFRFFALCGQKCNK